MPEVFGFVEENPSEAQRRKSAASEERGEGKDGTSLSPPQHTVAPEREERSGIGGGLPMSDYTGLDKRGGKHLTVVACAVSQLDSLGQRHASCWDLTTMGAVKYTPQGEILGNVLELMLGPRGHEQEVA